MGFSAFAHAIGYDRYFGLNEYEQDGNYGGYDEIIRAVNQLIKDGVSEVTVPLIRSKFDNPDIPPVDFIVRSAGEERLSNFLLFDSAYSELGFYDRLWPDWDEEMIKTVKQDFLKRDRRFGGLS